MPAYYLSPHPDDVALSCGGSLLLDVAAGEAVTLVAVFDPAEDAARRAQEDRAACARLGCARAALELPEAPARPELRGRLDLFQPLSVPHLGILNEVTSRLMRLIPPGSTVVAPLGVGGHVDHRLVQAAAQALGEDRPLQLWFYEDQPYSLAPYSLGRRLSAMRATVVGQPGDWGGAAQPRDILRADRRREIRAYHAALGALPMTAAEGLRLPPLRWLALRVAARAAVDADAAGHQPGFAPRLSPQLRDVTAVAEGRFAAAAAYDSQIPLLFGDAARLRARLLGYGAALDGAPADRHCERLWRWLPRGGSDPAAG